MRKIVSAFLALIFSASLVSAQTIIPSGGGGGGSPATSAVVNPAPGFYPYPAQGDLYARFLQPTQSYYSPSGGATSTFSTWLTSVSGTFTRSGSVGPAWDASGLLVNYAANQPRFSYDPVSLVPNLIYEPASSNLYQYTQQPATGPWAFSNIAITRADNAATGMDGTTSAGTFRETTANSQHLVWHYDASASVTSGLFYAEQYFIKPVNRTRMKISTSTGLPASIFYVDFTNVTVSNPAWNIKLLANGYYWLYRVAAATGTGIPSTLFYLLDSNGVDTYTGSTSAGWNLGGSQLEQVASATSQPSSYMQRPNATAVSRSADALSFTLPAGASSLTYSFANGSAQVVSVSPGAYSVPTTLNRYQIANFIDVDLTQVPAPVLSVAGRTGNVALQQSDVSGLKTTDIGTFSALETSGSTQFLGSAVFRNESSLFQWTSGSAFNAGASPAARYVLIGSGAGNMLVAGSQSNTVIIGTQAVGAATSAATSVIVGDTAGNGTSISGSVAIGNEAGNVASTGSFSGSNIIGNGAGKISAGGVYTRVDAMGQTALRDVAATDAVVIGNGAVYDTTASGRTLTQSVVLGSKAGNTIAGAGTSTGLILIGYNAQPATPTTSNYLNIGNALQGDMSGGTYSFTTSGAGDANTYSAVLRTKAYTVGTLPSAATAGAGARAFVTDAVACTFAAAVTGGGSAGCPLYSDGSAWVGG